jgi:hypothetical protein
MRTTIRRIGLTVAVAGIAAFGGVAVAPAASAAPDNPRFIVDQDGNRVEVPVFCDLSNLHKQHTFCVMPGGPRF